MSCGVVRSEEIADVLQRYGELAERLEEESNQDQAAKLRMRLAELDRVVDCLAAGSGCRSSSARTP